MGLSNGLKRTALSRACRSAAFSTTQRAPTFLTNASSESSSNLHTFEQLESYAPESSMVWIDMEMTGLDYETETIMEIACIITDKDLNVIAEAEDLILKVADEKLNSMDEWCIAHHGQSGLTDACRNSNVSLAEAEEKLLTFLRQHVPKGAVPWQEIPSTLTKNSSKDTCLESWNMCIIGL